MPTLSKKRSVAAFALMTCGVALVHVPLRAGDLKISIPKRSEMTPVQKLNREGVEAVRKRQYRKAENLFYKAYLFDPDDPFTLNNLGYISELAGQVDRAAKYYALAAQQAGDAIIDQSSSSNLKGEPLRAAIGEVQDVNMRINQANVEAVRLLSRGRAREAEAVLESVEKLDPKNAFTLNNIGLAKEMQGYLPEALKYYTAAADLKSGKPVVVTLNSRWRGKPVSDMAAESAKAIRERMRQPESAETRAAELNLRGVSAVNRNDWSGAAKDFNEAYRLNPEDAFSLNNRGFLAEMEGDPETAQVFYQKAKDAQGESARIGVASQSWAEGMKLSAVADDADQKIESHFDAQRAARQKKTGPIQLMRRDNTPVIDPPASAQPDNQQEGPPQPPIPQLEPPKTPDDPTNQEPHL
jgi:Flp pilus assembly protein TadD